MAIWEAVDDECKKYMTRPFNMRTAWDAVEHVTRLDAFGPNRSLPNAFYTVQGFAGEGGRVDSVQSLLVGQVGRGDERDKARDKAKILKRLDMFGPTTPMPTVQTTKAREERRDGFLRACRLGAMVGHAMACIHGAG